MSEPEGGIPFATWQDRQLALLLARSNELLNEIRTAQLLADNRSSEAVHETELARITPLLEARDREARRLAEQREELASDVTQWQSKAAALGKQLEELSAIQAELQSQEQRLRDDVTHLQRTEKNYAYENQTLSGRAGASAVEADNLRRLLHDLENSLSWKITAPLRAVTKPLFRALAPPAPTAEAAPTVGPLPPAEEPRQEAALKGLLAEVRRAQSIAVIPCAIPFSSTLNQRPISCARYLADHGTTVLYVAWQWQPEEAVPNAWGEVYPRVFHVPLYGFLNHVESIAAASPAKGSYLCTLPSPGLVEVVRPLRAAGYHIHYDIMDDWEGFHRGGEAPWFSAGVEQEMVVLADTVTAVSDRLAEKFGGLRSDIEVVRNGYQPAALASEQFAAARSPLAERKVVGYFGHFSDAWFYWDAVIHAAKERPDIDFELIGWGISEPTQKRLKALPNIRPIGIVPQKELHKYARNWWLGMIPFQPTEVSAAVDPLKVYEYLHLGLPTVVTGISGIARYPLVEYAEDRESFVAAIDRVRARPGEPRLAEVAAFLKDCVWEERFAKLHRLLKEPAGLAFLYGR